MNWAILPLNPQENTCKPFQNNLNTRILEKDYFVAEAPCVKPGDSNELYSKPFNGYGNNVNVNHSLPIQFIFSMPPLNLSIWYKNSYYLK